MKKKNKKIIFSVLALFCSATVGVTLANYTNSASTESNSVSKLSSSQQSTDISDLVPAESNDQNANLSTTNGPVTFWGNTITALDWYGAELWSIDMSNYVADYNGSLPGSTYSNHSGWSRAWFNWDYNRSTNTIWVLGYYGGSNTNQQLFAIDASTGSITQTVSLGDTGEYHFVTALASGNVLAYGTASSGYDATGKLYNASTDSVTTLSGNSASELSSVDGNGTANNDKYRWYFYNLIPVASNINLACVISFSTVSTTDDTTAAQNASYDAYFIMVDDDLNATGTGTWASPVKVASGLQGYRNTQITPQRDYYTMLSGEVATVVYNTVIVIDPTNTSDVTLSTFTMSDAKWIKSWALDANENLYFKFKDDTKIYKIAGDTLQEASTSSTVTPTTYIDLSAITSNNVNSYAANFVIFNVYGYTGQLMLVNEKYNAYIQATASLSESSNQSTMYGLAIAITQNASDSSQGDYQGLLNTSDSFQQSADFTISDSVLDSKIPSEITESDITTLNDSFFSTSNSDYVPFTISDIDDQAGTFSVTCNLYKIPWFSSTLPTGSTPKTITKTFTTSKTISDKTSWITLSENTNYDFLNMLPSNITTTDVENLDPFQVSFQSQTITNSSGTQLYPSKAYSITSQDDATGSVTISVTYSYVPMGVTYTDGSDGQVLTYTTSHTYTVFKSGDQSAFYFIGSTTANAANTTIDVSTVPQLESLLESNVLPSSFEYLNSSSDATNSAFLQFINTSSSKGYPISKMSFTVSADDTNGTLTIKATMPTSYAPDKATHTYSVTYTGLNKTADYSFSFNSSATKIDGSSFDDFLPSSITSGQVISNLITYQGYNSNDFSVSLTPDDVNGTLTVSITLDSDYASSIGTSGHGFTNYAASYTFSGFMTTDEYNNQYTVDFVDDSDVALLDLKQLTTVEIYNDLSGTNPTGLKVGSKTYQNLNDLVENLLVSSLGASVPTDWKDNSEITTTMYYNNSLGTASFYVHIPQDLMTGASSDLNLIASYTGFVKGNIDSTDDNLSFIANNMLQNYLVSQGYFTSDEYAALTPTTFAEWIEKDNNITKLITYDTGEYATKLSSGDYTVTVIPNEVQKTVVVTIDFGTMTNSKSLSEYSIQYSL